MRRIYIATGLGAALTLLILSLATQFVASVFSYQAALGKPIVSFAHGAVYAPWSVLLWRSQWSTLYPRPFAVADFILLVGAAASLFGVLSLLRGNAKAAPFGKEAWASFSDVNAAGLFAQSGTVLGKFEGEILAFDGQGHQILIGASRSGKGRGHVVPTLLSWPGSALVLDVKGELDAGDPRHGFPGASGYRAGLGPVFRFAPTCADSHAFNPLHSVRKGENEVRDVQNIVDMIVQPFGETKGSEQFWNNSGKNILAGVVLHVLYTEPDERKSLAVVRERLRDLDKTAREMGATLHRRNPVTGQGEIHPEILHAAESYLAGEDRLRSGVKATAESFFGVFADPIVAKNTSQSDFCIGDLMCAERPVTLYLQPPPSDAQRLMPLMRIFIAQMARSLMEHQTKDARGRVKKHRLLLMLDEFPQLGRIDFFEKMMGAMAGYGLKAYLVCQSLNHISRAYGHDNVILDNCHLVTAFAAADPETAKRISDMAGDVWEVRPQQSELRPRALFGPARGAVTYREERRPLIPPSDVRSLPNNEQLIFVSGCAPIRAKKLKFDTEALFAKRLRPPAPMEERAVVSHDWSGVRAFEPSSAKRESAASQDARAPRPPRAQQSPKDQGELFASPPAKARELKTAKRSQSPTVAARQGDEDARSAPAHKAAKESASAHIAHAESRVTQSAAPQSAGREKGTKI